MAGTLGASCDGRPACTGHLVAGLQELTSRTLFCDDFVSISIILIQSNFVIGGFLKICEVPFSSSLCFVLRRGCKRAPVMLWVCKMEGPGSSRSGESKGSVERGPDLGPHADRKDTCLVGGGRVGEGGAAGRPRMQPHWWAGAAAQTSAGSAGWVGMGFTESVCSF